MAPFPFFLTTLSLPCVFGASTANAVTTFPHRMETSLPWNTLIAMDPRSVAARRTRRSL